MKTIPKMGENGTLFKALYFGKVVFGLEFKIKGALKDVNSF